MDRLRADAPERPSIIFIPADGLGYMDVACYGCKYYETPNIHRLAPQSIRFTSGQTCGPNCLPTRAALMSGQYMPRVSIYTVGSIDRFDWHSRPLRPVDNVTELPLDKMTVALALKKVGYATAVFGKWHLGGDSTHHPAKRGIDEAMVSTRKHLDFKTSPNTDHPKGAYLADFLTNKAKDFIRRHQDGPLFLYLPHFGMHAPHAPKNDLIARFKPSHPPAVITIRLTQR